MGFAECSFAMESRTGSVSSGLGSRAGVRGQSVKSSPFCPRSSSKMTQSIVRDHMVSHYKKVYSAKAAVDASVPKSITFSVKYNDQIRQDRLRKGGRPQSAHSLSQRNSRASSSSSQSTLSVQYDDNPYLCSRSSMLSSPRFNTSFHAKEIVYQSCKRDLSHHTRSASEFQFHSPESALHRKHSACSLTASGGQSCYKTFQDPIQKTYSGDILQKHSQHFTQEKPFTPKTLKSEKSSYLEKYRYYRAPRRTITQDSTSSKLMRQETNHRSTKTKEYTQDFDEPSQGFTTDHEWSEDEFNGTYLSESRQQSQLNKSRERYLFNSSRFSQECVKSPLMKKISAEEEELMYLEFISAVTEDILSRGNISDRVLDRVTMHHIEMNRHQLDEGKMRHLLVVLRKDFDEPANTSTSTAELEKKENGLLDSLLPYLESGRKPVKTKDRDVLPYASLIKISDSLDYTDALSVSATLHSPERTASPTKTNETDKEEDDDDKEKCTGSENVSGVSEEDVQHNQPDTTATNEEISNENHEKTTITSDEEFHQDQAEVSHDDGQSKELEDLGRRLSESLHVSSNTDSHDPDAANEQHENTVASVSDDEF